MSKLDIRQESIDAIQRRIADLNDQSLTQLSRYISYLKWQEELWNGLLDQEVDAGAGHSLSWSYDFLDNFSEARLASTRTAEMMEIKVAPATCGLVQQRSLWEHPPISGSAVCEYEIQVPANLNTLRLRFAIGIHDGAVMEGDNVCAFRIYVNGVRLWSTTKQSITWERFTIDLPSLSGQQMIIQFMTDSLDDNRWNWAVWGEPTLLGYGPQSD